MKFPQLFASGAALGAVYALVGLGFVVIYRATGVINFAQAGMVVLGAFLVYGATTTLDLSFWLALLVAMGLGALLGIVLERVVLRRMIGRPVYAVILVTVGLLLLVEPVVTTIWENPATNIETPWGLGKVTIGSVNILQVDVATVVIAGTVLGAFFAFFRYTKYGVAMRATAIDQEAALAQGINVQRIVALSWAIAGVVAVLAGTMLGSGAGPATGLGVGIGIISLKALPAVVLGGLDSPLGAVVGGLLIGITEVLMAGYQNDVLPFLPDGFAAVMPWVVMLIVLLVRPYGLFGTRDVRRI
ncbi:MAG TPA: branched-chain amino acid ABC transporter permease [Acidimicrobiia bacterium]|nr:branched-chain amino acid ABC transporter permease [Acidimicrobiia bacterium]